ncbi:MAG TPA: ABC transporter substrate-binding protein [Mycobacteriales bacterium]|nr:ABC transporter substrate-binding protein [Mycobacteriales bacterium]
MRAALVAVLLAAPLAACSSGGGCGGAKSCSAPGVPPVVVAVPRATAPWVADFMTHGAQLGAKGALKSGDVPVEVVAGDTASDVATAARKAAAEHALALITDGTATDAVDAITEPANVPVFVVFDGGANAADAARFKHVYRIAPADHPMAIHLADYVSGHHPKVALIVEASPYGRDGAAQLRAAFARDSIPVLADAEVTSSVGAAPALVAARRKGADTVVVWGSAPIIAQTIQAARGAGWAPSFYTSPDGEDPYVRRQLAQHPDWIDGLTFVSGRITSEQGPKPYDAWRAAYTKLFGVEKLGLTDGGREVTVPPTWAQYPYDAVKLIAAAYENAGGAGAPLVSALDTTVITGANGDERGFTDGNREGVIGDDVCFERFHGLRFAPVTDDVLLQGLPTVDQG